MIEVTAGESFNEKYKDCAIYLPSLQQAYAAFPFRDPVSVRAGDLPKGLALSDLDFLNPNSKLWHCKYVLYSAGQFDRAQIRTPDMVSERAAGTVVVGDSGGYQIGTGKLKAVRGWYRFRNDPSALAAHWTMNVAIRDRIMRWLDRYCDYAMTLDMPLWVLQDPKARKSSPFANLSVDQLIDLSYDNLRYFADNRGKATGRSAKYLNILQDIGEDTGERWYQRVKDFEFEGWAFGSDTKSRIDPILRWVRRLLDDGKLNSKTEWLHILGVSTLEMGVYLTALQRRLRVLTGNPDFVVSYDSSSPFRTSGISQKIAVLPELSDDIKTWRIRNVLYPQHPQYKSRTDIRYLEDIASPVTKLVSINDFHAKAGPMETRFFDTLAQHLLTNHNIYVYHKAATEAEKLLFTVSIPIELTESLRQIDDLQ